MNSPSCNGQCRGCAYKPGADANREPDNHLRGIFAALGGYPFYCHDSLGWSKKGYAKDATQALAILSSRGVLIKLGASERLIESEVAEIRRGMKACAGWKASVARLQAAGWFRKPGVALYRRYMARGASVAMERLTKDSPERDGNEVRTIETAIGWFFNEAREAGTKIGWLFGETPGRMRLDQ